MTYDLHPLVVHFPIALLFLYSIIKIIPFQKWFPRISWKQLEQGLLLVGVLGAALALATGETAEHLMRPNHVLVEMHSLFAGISTGVYGALLFGELISMTRALIERFISWLFVKKVLFAIEKILQHPVVGTLLAVVGLIAISVTGVLGGVLAYGPSKDPFASLVLSILGIQL